MKIIVTHENEGNETMCDIVLRILARRMAEIGSVDFDREKEYDEGTQEESENADFGKENTV